MHHSSINYKFLEEGQLYNGDQLTSQFNYRTTGIVGDSIIAFIGEMGVSPSHMVDIEDVVANDFIYSPKALNFIIELFDINIETTALYQRAFMRIIVEQLKESILLTEGSLRLHGDDIYLDRPNTPPAKMSVSIATVSKVSGLIHAALNIELSDKIPVFASCLTELGLSEKQVNVFAYKCGSDFQKFVADIKRCKYKVLGV